MSRRLSSGSCPNEKVVLNEDTSGGGTIVTCFVVNEDRGDHGHVFRGGRENNVHAGTFSRSGVISPDLVVCGPLLGYSNGAVIAGNSRASAVCSYVGRNRYCHRTLLAHRFRPSTPGCAPEVSNIIGPGNSCILSVLGSGVNIPRYLEFFCRCPTCTNLNRFVRACGYSNSPVPSFRNRPAPIRVNSRSVSRFASVV